MKTNFLQYNFLRKFVQLPLNTFSLKVYTRSLLITQEMVGLRLKIHNGKEFIVLLIDDNMIGYKLGEFVGTRVRAEFKKSKKKKK